MHTTRTVAIAAAILGVTALGEQLHSQQPAFQIEEITIAGIHEAIQQGRTTCVGVVQAYLDRAKAYNGVSNWLVTADGATIPKPPGQVRAGSPLAFPTKTIPIASLLPNFSEYAGPAIEFGRMEATASDPEVMQQYGMTVGIPNAGQVNALGMFNVRGERSTTCKGARDTHPSKGALPAGSPKVCEELRKMPDALERAAELDAQFGRTPDLGAMPMYCVPFSFKDPFDTKDMRSTGGGDARYDIDFPARDHTLVAQLRKKGAIIYAKANTTEYNGRAGDPGGRNKPDKILVSTLGYQRSTWAGNPSNPYDTTRAASLGSSSGSGVSVGANLVTCSLCEETRASCRGPANHNSVALLLPQKALVSFHGGAIGSDIHNDRTGIHCRSIADSAKVLDALRDEKDAYYDTRDVFTTIPRSAVLDAGEYTKAAAMTGAKGSLKGMRIGIIRESMLTFPGVKADEPIVKAANAEIKAWLGDYLGATLVESSDPKWVDDPAIENMTTSYTKALAELIPVFFPDVLYRVTSSEGGRRGRVAGTAGSGPRPVFPDFAAAITPTPFAPGVTLGSGTMQPADYMVAMADGKVPPPSNLNIRTVQPQAESKAFRFHFVQYATRRADDWKELGYEETLVDFPTLNARSKFWGDDQRAAFKNWEETPDIRNPIEERQGIHERFLLRELLRRVEMKVLQENKLDVVVRLHSSLPPGKIGLAPQPAPEGDTRGESAFGPNAGLTEVLIPAGYVREVYDPVFVLSADKTRYVPTNNNTPITMPEPGLPFSLVFRAEPGKEDLILKAASAYQAASKRRVPPPAFGPLKSETPRPSDGAASGNPAGDK
jgi:Asp-tRNA(Asn)/Glu-tRNA(Gln) amidotransferase A subunit family amidase